MTRISIERRFLCSYARNMFKVKYLIRFEMISMFGWHSLSVNIFFLLKRTSIYKPHVGGGKEFAIAEPVSHHIIISLNAECHTLLMKTDSFFPFQKSFEDEISCSTQQRRMFLYYFKRGKYQTGIYLLFLKDGLFLKLAVAQRQT